ncbi:MAG: metallophosphoesterase [Hyphomicrobiaceae bacterium]|nr:metallophosphoesterase [Hyphomicrobiaceae bacterium]
MISRRRVLTAAAGLGAGSFGLGGLAVAGSYGLQITRYALTPPNWPAGLHLKLAIVTDLHACDPWMSADRIRGIVQTTNALEADAVLLLGDFVAGKRLARLSSIVPHHVWAGELAALKAPLGVHAVLGNHDWWESDELQETMQGQVPAQAALEAAGIPVYQNRAVRLMKDAKPVWLAGLGDQWAYYLYRHREKRRGPDGKLPFFVGVDDLPATLAMVTDDAPIVLMVHEPDIFPAVPDRVALTVAGHTHGGQVRVFGFAPIIPSLYGRRYDYGHIVEDDRNLIVSAGLGCSNMPLRLGAVPEIVAIELGGPALI